MSKNQKFNIQIFLLTLLLFLGLSNNSHAIEANTIKIDISKYEINEDALTYKYWDITGLDINKDNMFEVTERLNKLSEAELNAQFTKYEVRGSLENSHIVIGNLGATNYYFRNRFETEKNIYDTKFSVLFKDVEGYEIEVKNKYKITPKKSGEVELSKVDDKGKPLKDAIFRLYKIEGDSKISVPLIGNYTYNESGTKNLDLLTDTNGKIKVNNLPYGKYSFEEIKAPEGHEIKNKNTEFIIKGEEKVFVKVINPRIPYGGHDFLKISDDKNKTPLEGAEFIVRKLLNGKYEDFYQNGKPLKLISDKKGKMSVRNLPYGTYYLFETKAPKDHILLEGGVKFEIDSIVNSSIIVIKNKKPPFTPPPRTGDDFNALLYGGIITISILALIFIVKSKKK